MKNFFIYVHDILSFMLVDQTQFREVLFQGILTKVFFGYIFEALEEALILSLNVF